MSCFLLLKTTDVLRLLWINELHLFGYILKRSTNNYTHLGVIVEFFVKLEQGKETLRMDKVNQVLALFGHKVGAVPIRKEDEE